MDINELKKKRERIKFKIMRWKKSGKNAKKLVDEYHDILSELNKLGVKAEIRTDYLTKEYWENWSNIPSKNCSTQTYDTPTHDSFVLCLAWVDDSSNIPEQVIKVKKYFEELSLPILNEENNNINNRIEHILKYKFTGSEESFRLLKTCAQFVLDSFAKTDFERFNIAIYGNRKKF
jgi:flagellar hook-associated protein FlgK